MPYTTKEQVREILTRNVGVPSGTAASLDDDVIEEQVNSAEGEVNMSLGVRYTVPFSDPVPEVVSDITRDIAAYLCDLVYRQSVDFSSDNDPVLRRYERAKEMLTALQSGRAVITPDPDGGSGSEPTSQARGFNRNPARFFTLDDFGLGVSESGRKVNFYGEREW